MRWFPSIRVVCRRCCGPLRRCLAGINSPCDVPSAFSVKSAFWDRFIERETLAEEATTAALAAHYSGSACKPSSTLQHGCRRCASMSRKSSARCTRPCRSARHRRRSYSRARTATVLLPSASSADLRIALHRHHPRVCSRARLAPLLADGSRPCGVCRVLARSVTYSANMCELRCNGRMRPAS